MVKGVSVQSLFDVGKCPAVEGWAVRHHLLMFLKGLKCVVNFDCFITCDCLTTCRGLVTCAEGDRKKNVS